MVSTGGGGRDLPSAEGARPSEAVVMGSSGAGIGATVSAIRRWQRRLCVFKDKADRCPAAVAAVAAGITSAPPIGAVGAEKWEAESSLLPPSSISEKHESSVGWGRS